MLSWYLSHFGLETGYLEPPCHVHNPLPGGCFPASQPESPCQDQVTLSLSLSIPLGRLSSPSLGVRFHSSPLPPHGLEHARSVDRSQSPVELGAPGGQRPPRSVRGSMPVLPWWKPQRMSSSHSTLFTEAVLFLLSWGVTPLAHRADLSSSHLRVHLTFPCLTHPGGLLSKHTLVISAECILAEIPLLTWCLSVVT